LENYIICGLKGNTMQYGIRMLVSNWACKDGGDDYTGTKEEMTALLNSWKKEGIQQGVRYTVIPYNGENGIPPAFPNQPENSRNSRMKRVNQ
jgi:hypothetical protein